VDKICDNHKSDAIVKTILMLGTNLGIEVVAEGVETVDQLQLLRSLGCKLGQGFLFSKPVDAAEAEKLITGFSDPSSFTSLMNIPDEQVYEYAGIQ